jgi:hypothetical protein
MLWTTCGSKSILSLAITAETDAALYTGWKDLAGKLFYTNNEEEVTESGSYVDPGVELCLILIKLLFSFHQSTDK